MRLVLIRHGASQHAQRGIIAGRAGCIGLTAPGVAQMTALAHYLTSSADLRDCSALLSSPVCRARESADLLLAALRVDGVEEDEGLREVDPGLADGLSWEDYRARYEPFDLVSEPDRPFAPGGESWTIFLQRIETTLDRLATRFEGQTVIAVTHAGVIVATLLVLFAIPRPGTGAQFDPEYASITEWRYGDKTWRLVRYNETCHLRSSSYSAGS